MHSNFEADQMENDQQLPDHVRDQAIEYLNRYLDSKIQLEDACRKARKLSRVKWFREMLDELADYEQPDMPYSATDSCFHPHWAESATRRTICFLEQGRQYDDGLKLWQRLLFRIAVILFLVSLFSVFATSIAQDYLGEESWAGKLFPVFAIVTGSMMAVLFSLYAIGLLGAGIHIFRVRVLRQDLRSKSDLDIWPYLNREDYEHDKATSFTRSIPLQADP